MLLRMYTVYDSKVEAFLPPFFMKSRGEAIRAFTEVCSNSASQFAKYPSDYTLFELGSWDDASSKFDLNKTPYSLGLAVEFVKALPLSAAEPTKSA